MIRPLIFTILFMMTGIMAPAQDLFYITANGETRTATPADNAAAKALLGLLADGPVRISMRDYGGWEKVGDLPGSLPSSDSHITAQPGDIMLYQGSQMVIFYGDNSWSYTRLGRIDGLTASDIRSWLSGGSVEITLSLSLSTGVDDVSDGADDPQNVFDLSGRPVDVRPLPTGIYLIDGKKKIVR